MKQDLNFKYVLLIPINTLRYATLCQVQVMIIHFMNCILHEKILAIGYHL